MFLLANAVDFFRPIKLVGDLIRNVPLVEKSHRRWSQSNPFGTFVKATSNELFRVGTGFGQEQSRHLSYQHVRPPSMTTFAPVMKDDASDTKKTTAAWYSSF